MGREGEVGQAVNVGVELEGMRNLRSQSMKRQTPHVLVRFLSSVQGAEMECRRLGEDEHVGCVVMLDEYESVYNMMAEQSRTEEERDEREESNGIVGSKRGKQREYIALLRPKSSRGQQGAGAHPRLPNAS
ncbi:hypothetical protein Hypma_004257 [Hypsizygus marmoreus]|uniref:Uncharacterized protein n=1 Tax=Hypsizygus marmoreus TaxID=39966 RepID=A0A369J9E4_HYPMA|nr:hypothetical protein Hypma_004257 [Hypsizygus marmoreus]